MKFKKLIALFLISIMSFSLISCGSSSDESTDETTEFKVDSETGVVVATSVAVTWILDALGVNVTGVPTSSYELPESTADATEVGNPMSPDMEIIKSLNPDIVVSVDTLGSDYMELFTENDIPSEFVSLSSIDDLKETITTLGDIFSKEDEATELVAEIDAKEEEATEIAEAEEETKDILLVFAVPGSVMLATSTSYVGSIVDLVGGNNVITDDSSSFVTINYEDLAQLDPDMVLVMFHAMPEESQATFESEIESNIAWQNMSAIQEGNIVYLDVNYFGISADLNVTTAIDEMREIIYGE